MRFSDTIESLKQSFSKDLLGDIQKELNTVIEQSGDKEAKIARYQEIIDIIEKININE